LWLKGRFHHEAILIALLQRFMPIHFYLRVAGTLLISLAAALLCVWLHTPLPWMIGPLLATGLVSVLGWPTQSWNPLRNAGQCTIGTALGLYFTPQVTALVLSLWWAIGLSTLWALLIGLLSGLWLHRLHAKRIPGLHRATTYFSGAIGGAAEMTQLAERENAQTDLVASAHTMRLLIVTVLIPFAMQFSGVHGDALSSAELMDPGVKSVSLTGLLLLGLAAALGAWSMERMGRANPWFIGSLLVSMGLTMSGIELSAIPRYLSNAAQLVIGVSLGVRFSPAFVHTAPRWLLSAAAGAVVMIGLSALFAWVLAWGAGLNAATLVLATAPGGVAEMSITAKVLQLGAPVVTAFQVCRLVLVMVLAEPIYRRYFKR
jgi:membrane AbrB-like protein